VTIVAVTKTHGPDAARAAYEAGLHDVGENKVQEALKKMDRVEVPVRWHLIGHLQRNKVKSLDRFALFHALDSARLADAVSAFGLERGKAVEVLVQVNLAEEASKGGFSLAGLGQHMVRLVSLEGLNVRGVMTMAGLEADEGELRRTFAGARDARLALRQRFPQRNRIREATAMKGVQSALGSRLGSYALLVSAHREATIPSVANVCLLQCIGLTCSFTKRTRFRLIHRAAGYQWKQSPMHHNEEGAAWVD